MPWRFKAKRFLREGGRVFFEEGTGNSVQQGLEILHSSAMPYLATITDGLNLTIYRSV